ncbi:unnamed protein product [Ectocarpus sp. 12 AP-2014]
MPQSFRTRARLNLCYSIPIPKNLVHLNYRVGGYGLCERKTITAPFRQSPHPNIQNITHPALNVGTARWVRGSQALCQLSPGAHAGRKRRTPHRSDTRSTKT